MPLQKSFSEQHSASRSRQTWNRSKTHSGAHTTPRTTTSRPLQPVSVASKNKLHAFEFQGPAKTAGSDENCSVAKRAAECDPNKKIRDPPEDGGQTNAERAAITPHGKLAWQELIGISEDREEEEDTSPNERILWESKRREGVPDISPMITRRRGKKRARSSSPVSSPSNHSKPATPAVNVKKLTQALKSAHADPALELWDRFALSGSTNTTPHGVANPALAQIMVSSSPQPSKILPAGIKDPGTPTGSSLRRAISCGANWPKRRRTDRGEYVAQPSAALEQSPSQGTKNSMVNALLQSVNGELNRSKAIQTRHEASKSPSPTKKRQNLQPSNGSPKRRSPPPRPPPPLFKSPVKPPTVGTKRSQTPDVQKDDSSDYGEDDFDDDTLMVLDASLAPNHEEMTTAPLSSDNVLVAGSEMAPGAQQTSDDDEFGDMDDDVFAAAEDMIAVIDSSHTSLMTPGKAREDIAVAEPTVSTCQTKGVGNNAYDDDDFGDDFDFEAAEVSATQAVKQLSSVGGSGTPVTHKAKAIQRYLVLKVLETQYTDDFGRSSPEKILFVQVDRSNAMKTIHLRGDWIDTSVNAKAFVHVIGLFEPTGQCIIDNNQNILILHPDQLISATVVADSFTCMRRAVLQDRVKATSEASAPLVYGTLLHEIFQEAMMSNEWHDSSLDSLIVKITEKHVEDLYKIRVSMGDAREHLRSKMTELKHWAAAFVSDVPKPDAVVQGRNGDKGNMCVSKLLDVEEHVWSPMYGLKGNIDATVQVTMKDGPKKRTLTVPFEVKTGKNATSNHQAQTSLYNLLLADRYDIEIAYGILYYMESSKTIRIPTIRHELRHMIMQRNELACYVRERSVQLPPMKRSTNTCGNCYAKVSCFIYHKLADNGDAESSSMKNKFDEVVKHLTPTHQEFFLKWEDLLTKEEKEGQRLRRELWTMLSSEREKVGRCFANVMIEEGSAHEQKDSPKINRYTYTFIKDTPAPGFSFVDSQLAVGEPIVVSDEQGHFALALGFVTSVRKQRISVAVDRRLHNARIRQPGFDEQNNQVFASIMEVVPEGVAPALSQGKVKKSPIRYRLDKDEFSNGMATVRNNLVQIMANDIFGSREIRRLVVDLAPPTFKAVSTQYTIKDQGSLNVDQRKAIQKVMSANDYALVLGMPGTGKTTTIAHIIRALVCQGKSVLLTSYTHSAVDNILLKLQKDKIPILRLGAPAKVHPGVQDFAILASQRRDTFEEIHDAWHNTPIVATTCLGVSHPVFNERTFDYCIVDEASQITLPICLGPIRLAKTFVLVGDHNQLPPLVQNEEARVGGLDISLFKLLSDTHPDSVVNLEHQYRMCEDVMALSNTLIYNGHLKCGTEELRHRRLEVPNMEALHQKHYDASMLAQPGTPRSFCTNWTNASCWLHALVDPEARVRFINTDLLPDSREEAKGNRIVNPTEARIVTQLVDALLAVGVPATEIGVMTHYRSQLSLLKHNLRSHGSHIELHTADRFQGRDKEVVVLSLVRSNEQHSIGDLLKDWRRINVAFTRAKTKLLVVGSKDTLRNCGDSEMVSRFVRLMEEREWVFDLPADALESHWFEEGQTQVTATGGAHLGTQGSQIRNSQSPAKKGARKSPLKGRVGLGAGKENMRPMPMKGKVTEKALLKGKPVLTDIFNELMSSGY
ncbi:putative DNA replication ATP-dependent helicase/nuclease [Seiridium cardinale]|uniref:DNA replication ATP-dependent helicase/nuclease n=1 Tax=Seiridium cardinale TaxID=138064 RepID=A0ABR2XGE7_9PEZI